MRRLILGLALVSVTTPLAAQSLLYRSPNLGGTWTGDGGVVHFNFLHRFTVSEGPAHSVLNFPTFTLAVGLGRSIALGYHFGTNSTVGQRSSAQTDNESEFYARWRFIGGREGDPGLAVSVTPAYNYLAESLDGELGADYTVGPVTVMGAARWASHAYGPDGDGHIALAGGLVARLTRYIAVSGDVGAYVDTSTVAAWSAALSFLIPGSPHTFSLQAGNNTTSTIQGNSFGGSEVVYSRGVAYGFEFTIPLHLSRFAPWFKGSGSAANAGDATATVHIAQLTFQTDTVIIPAGQSVRWVNDDELAHTVTFADAALGGSDLLARGQAFTRAFDHPGTYAYTCTPHPFMRGVVIVK